jgi:hypothetical protein
VPRLDSLGDFAVQTEQLRNDRNLAGPRVSKR